MKQKTMYAEDLRNLCIRMNWFTNGNNEQYQKLFDLNEEGASLEELALVIWICTPDRTREGILSILDKEVANRSNGGD